MKFLYLFMLTLFVSMYSHSAPYLLNIKQSTIQTQIDSAMPIAKSNFMGSAILDNPELALNGQLNQIEFWVDFDALILKKINAIGKCKISGKLHYDHKQGAFFLRESVIEELVMQKVKDKHIPIYKKLLHLVVKSSLKKNPLYILDEDDQKQKFAKASIKSVGIGDESLIVVMDLGL